MWSEAKIITLVLLAWGFYRYRKFLVAYSKQWWVDMKHALYGEK